MGSRNSAFKLLGETFLPTPTSLVAQGCGSFLVAKIHPHAGSSCAAQKCRKLTMLAHVNNACHYCHVDYIHKLIRPIGNVNEMPSKLRLYRTMHFTDLFIEDDGIEFLDHGTGSKFTQVATTTGTGTLRQLCRVLGKLDGRIANFLLQVGQFVLRFGTTPYQNVRRGCLGGETFQETLHIVEQSHGKGRVARRHGGRSMVMVVVVEMYPWCHYIRQRRKGMTRRGNAHHHNGNITTPPPSKHQGDEMNAKHLLLICVLLCNEEEYERGRVNVDKETEQQDGGSLERFCCCVD